MKRYTSNDEIESLCEALVLDFMQKKGFRNAHCVDIEALITDYLGLPLLFETFDEPDPGRVGFLADGRTSLRIIKDGVRQQVCYPKGTVVIEKYLRNAKECGRMRFTEAHEAAHFILEKHIPAQSNPMFHSEFSAEMDYTPDMLRQFMNINEMMVNRGAACLLMPRFLVMDTLEAFNRGRRILAYGQYIMGQDNKFLVQKMADSLGVNYSAFNNRLNELGLYELRPIEEYLARFHGRSVRA